jgi:hypothetical protein
MLCLDRREGRERRFGTEKEIFNGKKCNTGRDRRTCKER